MAQIGNLEHEDDDDVSTEAMAKAEHEDEFSTSDFRFSAVTRFGLEPESIHAAPGMSVVFVYLIPWQRPEKGCQMSLHGPVA